MHALRPRFTFSWIVFENAPKREIDMAERGCSIRNEERKGKRSFRSLSRPGWNQEASLAIAPLPPANRDRDLWGENGHDFFGKPSSSALYNYLL